MGTLSDVTTALSGSAASASAVVLASSTSARRFATVHTPSGGSSRAIIAVAIAKRAVRSQRASGANRVPAAQSGSDRASLSVSGEDNERNLKRASFDRLTATTAAPHHRPPGYSQLRSAAGGLPTPTRSPVQISLRRMDDQALRVKLLTSLNTRPSLKRKRGDGAPARQSWHSIAKAAKPTPAASTATQTAPQLSAAPEDGAEGPCEASSAGLTVRRCARRIQGALCTGDQPAVGADAQGGEG